MTQPERFTTYKRADGELIGGEFAWVTELDFFDEESGFVDYLEIVEEVWTLYGRRSIIRGNLDRWCHKCDEDIQLETPVDGPVFCEAHRDNP